MTVRCHVCHVLLALILDVVRHRHNGVYISVLIAKFPLQVNITIVVLFLFKLYFVDQKSHTKIFERRVRVSRNGSELHFTNVMCIGSGLNANEWIPSRHGALFRFYYPWISQRHFASVLAFRPRPVRQSGLASAKRYYALVTTVSRQQGGNNHHGLLTTSAGAYVLFFFSNHFMS